MEDLPKRTTKNRAEVGWEEGSTGVHSLSKCTQWSHAWDFLLLYQCPLGEKLHTKPSRQIVCRPGRLSFQDGDSVKQRGMCPLKPSPVGVLEGWRDGRSPSLRKNWTAAWKVAPCFFLFSSHLLDPLIPCEIKVTLTRKLAACGIYAKAWKEDLHIFYCYREPTRDDTQTQFIANWKSLFQLAGTMPSYLET